MTKQEMRDSVAKDGEKLCMDKLQGFVCSRKDGHNGFHIAHGMFNYVLMTWDKKK